MTVYKEQIKLEVVEFMEVLQGYSPLELNANYLVPGIKMMITYLLQILGFTALTLAISQPYCKAIPGTSSWPSSNSWAQLNHTISGRLLEPSPPGAVCHPTEVTYNAAACPAVQAGWLTTAWHAENPVSSMENNWNNDTCLPIPTYPCSGEGYPIYVVNATCAEDVKRGVDFARENNVRLVVKGTGHDYLGRSVAPNSLSIWTHHLRGLAFHDGFTPKGCKFSIDGKAVTAAAGVPFLELDEAAHLRGLFVLSGGEGTVGLGGYLSGGGHAALSSTFGLAVDQVLEMEVVTPGGEILTINECQNTDLFWAMRGGGGSTFGVMTAVTIKAFQETPFYTATVLIATAPGGEAYWDVITTILSKLPSLDDQGISGYPQIAPNFSNAELGIKTPVDGFEGAFLLPGLSPSNNLSSLVAAVTELIDEATAPYPGQFLVSITNASYDNFWAWYEPNNGPTNAGTDEIIGSRLIDRDALTQNLTALKEAYKTATPPSFVTSAYLVGGKGVINAQPRGGSNSVNPAWRKAYVHSVTGVGWPPFDNTLRDDLETYLNGTLVEALRQLTPGGGAYVNEAYPYEPDWQQTFWGSNYERLLEIKKEVDPSDVFWCVPCVGNEGWQMVGDVLCRV